MTTKTSARATSRSSGGARTGIGTGSTAMFSTPTACITSPSTVAPLALGRNCDHSSPTTRPSPPRNFRSGSWPYVPTEALRSPAMMATAHRVYQGDRAHGFPLGRKIMLYFREQRDPSAERILVKVKPALASLARAGFRLTCVSRSRKSPSAPHIHSLLTEPFPLGIGVAREFIGQSPRMESSWLTCSGGWSQAMSEFARTPIEPARAFPPASTGSPIGSTDFANEKHYSINEIAKLWASQ